MLCELGKVICALAIAYSILLLAWWAMSPPKVDSEDRE